MVAAVIYIFCIKRSYRDTFHGHFIKIVIGLARGRKTYDKREYLKENDAKREIDKAMKNYRR